MIALCHAFRPSPAGVHADPAVEGVPNALGDTQWWIWWEHIRANFMVHGATSVILRSFNRPTWSAYTWLLAQARSCGARYAMVIEDDVFVPWFTLRRLYAALETQPEYGAAGGVYYAKRKPEDVDAPHVYHHPLGTGPWHDYPRDQFFRVGGAGLGCLLLRMEAVERAMEHGPLFDQEWGDEVGVRGQGGDQCLFHRLRQAGYAIGVDSAVRAWHRDHRTGTWFPTDPAVREARGYPDAPTGGVLQRLADGSHAHAGPSTPPLNAHDVDPIRECRKCGAVMTASEAEGHTH